MSPTGRDAIQEGPASEDAEGSQKSDFTPDLNKFTAGERAGDYRADTVHVQDSRKDQILLG